MQFSYFLLALLQYSKERIGHKLLNLELVCIHVTTEGPRLDLGIKRLKVVQIDTQNESSLQAYYLRYMPINSTVVTLLQGTSF